ncbi:MAG: ABC transporter ATP-binding protein [Planctomycetota bacterium]|jgi:ABC-2 type transport system ATP-binding protein
MIHVEQLTRRFPGVTAVDGVSFHVGKGWILGFLGPNGAGKTTTLRILSGYMPATSGVARLAGFDVRHQSREVRRRIGYLPENAPLYGEMRVEEYLRYRAALKGVPRKDARRNLDRVLDITRIRDHRKRIIYQLSKGYRQRVGLADALIHDPPILLLDEPSSGLDPNQIREMRQTLKDLAAVKTLVLSTHILPEVEAVCDHLVVIHRGKIVMKGELETLKKGVKWAGPLRVRGRGAEGGQMREALSGTEGVSSAVQEGEEGTFTLEAEKGDAVRERIYRLFVDRDWTLLELTRRAPTLEEMFVRATSGEGIPGGDDPEAGTAAGSEVEGQ